MDEAAILRAKERLEQAASSRPGPADLDAALERARDQVEALAQAAAALESTLPERIGSAVRDEALPVARQLAEVRGLMNQVIRRLERVEGDLLAERNARVDDLGLLVDLVTSGWRGVDDRLRRLEAALQAGPPAATVHRIDERLEQAR